MSKPAEQDYQPPPDCPLCPRLAEFRRRNRTCFPEFFNNPVPSFGSLDARLLIVGLAPGLKGANQTGRPFTGDYAGELLYGALRRLGLAAGNYRAHADDGLTLNGVRISNAVRCVPPENKPLPVEINACRTFLLAEIAAMRNLAAILTLGQIAHQSVVSALRLKRKDHAFAHGAQYRAGHLALIASYHCSRYNTSTGVLTTAMFESALAAAKTAAGL
ncbi:MAG TPA: uracil-DNA glycosylase [Micropepsaceae bacterium]|nr:uracil-DNA glycosylase [Micropepsaceae bacterium]